jgi:hypothetical protein
MNNQATTKYFPFPKGNLDQRNTVFGVKDWVNFLFEIKDQFSLKIEKFGYEFCP